MDPTRNITGDFGPNVLVSGINVAVDGQRRDHIIYSKGYNNLNIYGNYFEGMENGAAGGVKIRNGKNAYVGSNHFKDVPVLTYIYGDLTKEECVLYNTTIYNNLFHQTTNFGGQGTGILYYQSYRDGDTLEFKVTNPDGTTGKEPWDNAFGDVQNFVIYKNQFFNEILNNDLIGILGGQHPQEVVDELLDLIADTEDLINKGQLNQWDTNTRLTLIQKTIEKVQATVNSKGDAPEVTGLDRVIIKAGEEFDSMKDLIITDDHDTIDQYKIVDKVMEYKKADNVYEKIRIEKEELKNSYINNEDDTEKDGRGNIFIDNEDYRGWLNVENTNIDYPVLQSYDNQYYLDKDINREYLMSGSIFMNYLNDGFNDENTVLFGHNMRNGTMFEQLRKYKDRA